MLQIWDWWLESAAVGCWQLSFIGCLVCECGSQLLLVLAGVLLLLQRRSHFLRVSFVFRLMIVLLVGDCQVCSLRPQFVAWFELALTLCFTFACLSLCFMIVALLVAWVVAHGLFCCSRRGLSLAAFFVARGVFCCSRRRLLLAACFVARGVFCCSRSGLLLAAWVVARGVFCCSWRGLLLAASVVARGSGCLRYPLSTYEQDPNSFNGLLAILLYLTL